MQNKSGMRHEGPVVARARRATEEAQRDREMLGWIGRFRVVSSRELSVRFAVTEQRVNARVRRLLEAGLLGELRSVRSGWRLVYLSRRGAGRLGLPLRRPPQPDLDVHRELALAMLVALIEVDAPRGDQHVLTHREARRAERESGRRLSVDVGMSRRWPDLVYVDGGRMRAIELELFAKPTKRLKEIVQAYIWGSAFDETVWLVELPWVHKRIEQLVERAGGSWTGGGVHQVLRYRAGEEIAIARTIAALLGAKESPLVPVAIDHLGEESGFAPTPQADLRPDEGLDEETPVEPPHRSRWHRLLQNSGPGPGTRFFED